MDEGRDAQDEVWLSLGAETLPLRGAIEQEAERERVERLCLIGNYRGPRPSARAMLAAALAIFTRCHSGRRWRDSKPRWET